MADDLNFHCLYVIAWKKIDENEEIFVSYGDGYVHSTDLSRKFKWSCPCTDSKKLRKKRRMRLMKDAIRYEKQNYLKLESIINEYMKTSYFSLRVVYQNLARKGFVISTSAKFMTTKLLKFLNDRYSGTNYEDKDVDRKIEIYMNEIMLNVFLIIENVKINMDENIHSVSY